MPPWINHHNLIRNNMMTKLPDKPSKLLKLALNDLKKVEKDDNYRVDMDNWHNSMEGICYVCLAGAVMAKTLKIDKEVNFHPDLEEDFDIYKKLYALDSLRMGYLKLASKDLEFQLPKGMKDIPITDYHISQKRFKKGIRKLIRKLKKERL